MAPKWGLHSFGMVSEFLRNRFLPKWRCFIKLASAKLQHEKADSKFFANLWRFEMLKSAHSPSVYLGKIIFQYRKSVQILRCDFWQSNALPLRLKNRAKHSSYFLPKYGFLKIYFLTLILMFTSVNTELRNFSSDKMTLKFLIIKYLKCHLSFVTFAFTLRMQQFASCLCVEILRDGKCTRLEKNRVTSKTLCLIIWVRLIFHAPASPR